MDQSPRIAIDFGTTRTKVAWFDPQRGQPRLIELGQTQRAAIPSAFYIPKIGEGPILVGDDAIAQIESDPVGLVWEIKREIDKLGKKRCGPGRLTPTRVELTTALLAMIRQRCEHEVFHAAAIDRCALTVPVAFTEQQRDKLLEAATGAGFRDVRFIDEPTAAARAWLEETGRKNADHVVICDIGGGTTDFSLVSWIEGQFSVHPDVPPAGFAQGGNDIDHEAFAKLLDRQNEAEYGRLVQLRESLLIRMRAVKEQVSRGVHRLQLTAAGVSVDVPVDAFEAAVDEFCERLCGELQRFLDQCRTFGVENPDVVLVGGSSRIAGLKERIERLAPQRTYCWAHADFATVLGAVDFPESSGGFTSARRRHARADYAASLRAVAADDMITTPESIFLECRRAELEIGDAEAAEIERQVLGSPLAEMPLVDQKFSTRSAPDEKILDAVGRLIAQRKLDEAVAQLQLATLADTSVSEYYALQAKVAWQQGKWILACSSAAASIRLNPEDFDSVLLRGRCNLLMNRPKEGEQDLEYLRKHSPRHAAEATYHLAALFYRSGQRGRCASYLADLCRLGLSSRESCQVPPLVPSILLGLIALNEGEHERAKASLGLAFELAANSSDQQACEAGSLFWCFSPEPLHASDYQFPRLPDFQRTSLAFPAAVATPCSQCGLSYAYDGARCSHCSAGQAVEQRDRLLRAIERPLFEACRLCASDEVQAVREFDRIIRPFGRGLVGLAGLGSQEQLVQAAIVAAEHACGDDAVGEVAQLVERLAGFQMFDVRRLYAEPAVMALSQIRALLKPQLVLRAAWGWIFNGITITNASRFSVTAVEISVTVIRADGTQQHFKLRLDRRLHAGESHRWPHVFRDAGFFGTNIRDVHTGATCAQCIADE